MTMPGESRRGLTVMMLVGGLLIVGAVAVVGFGLAWGRGLPALTPPTSTPAPTATARPPMPPTPILLAEAPPASPRAAVVVVTATPTATPASPPTATATSTPLPAETATATLTTAPSLTPSPSPTPLPTATETPIPTATLSPTPTSIPTETPVPPPPTPTVPSADQLFLEQAAALSAGYASTALTLTAQLDAFDAHPLVVANGDWVRQTRRLLDDLRRLNETVATVEPPATYTAAWAEMQATAQIFTTAADQLERAIGLLEAHYFAEFRASLQAGQAALARARAALGL